MDHVLSRYIAHHFLCRWHDAGCLAGMETRRSTGYCFATPAVFDWCFSLLLDGHALSVCVWIFTGMVSDPTCLCQWVGTRIYISICHFGDSARILTSAHHGDCQCGWMDAFDAERDCIHTGYHLYTMHTLEGCQRSKFGGAMPCEMPSFPM